MQMSTLAALALATHAFAGLFQTSQLPTKGQMQDAYDSAAKEPGARHLPGLTIVGASCERLGERKVFCQIGYKLAQEAEERVYLDVATLEQSAQGGWILISGLCRG